VFPERGRATNRFIKYFFSRKSEKGESVFASTGPDTTNSVGTIVPRRQNNLKSIGIGRK